MEFLTNFLCLLTHRHCWFEAWWSHSAITGPCSATVETHNLIFIWTAESALHFLYVLLFLSKCISDSCQSLGLFSAGSASDGQIFLVMSILNSLRFPLWFLLKKTVYTCSFGLFASTLDDKYCVLIKHDSTFLKHSWKHIIHISSCRNRNHI